MFHDKTHKTAFKDVLFVLDRLWDYELFD